MFILHISKSTKVQDSRSAGRHIGPPNSDTISPTNDPCVIFEPVVPPDKALKPATFMSPTVEKKLNHFRATYQKPSRIYKYLASGWRSHPLFLERNLSYVNKHRARKLKPRPNDIDKIALTLARKNHGTSPSRSTMENRIVRKSPPVYKKTSCLYNWICNDSDKTSQKTRTCEFQCPWCEYDWRHLDSLFMHLKCCHPRFNFNLVEEDGIPVIEMSLNTSFDGSYCGFKYPGHNMRRDFKFTPHMPERRTNQTQLIFVRPKRGRPSQYIASCNPNNQRLKVIDEGDDVDVDVCSGRLYYHTSTCLPVKPNEGDIDSEADMDPDWARERTQLMIDEFTDVNEGEKELIKLWNLHIMSNAKLKSDSMIPKACLSFVEIQGNTILSKNLGGNFILHLSNLFDYGLLSSGDVLECVRALRNMRAPPTQASPTRASNKVKHEHCQSSPPAKRALLNSHCN